MSNYEKYKNRVRVEAIEYNLWYFNGECDDLHLDYKYINERTYYFIKMAKRYGLLKEFRENCVC